MPIPIRLLVLGALGFAALGGLSLVLMLIPGVRHLVGRLPSLFGVILVLVSLFALVLGIMIFSGQPWPEATLYIEFSLLLAGFSFGGILINVAWLIAKSPKGLSGVLGASGGLIALVALIITLLPSFQMVTNFSTYENEIKKGLGNDYFGRIPEPLRAKMLSGQFNLNHYWDNYKVTPGDYVEVDEVAYRSGGNEQPKLNIFHPPLRTGGENKFPTLLVIHGGGWQTGSRYEVNEFNLYMASRGWTVFSIDYRLAPAAIFPAPQEDVQCALAFIAKEGSKYGADVSRLGAIGRSAGGTLALYAAYNPAPLAGAQACGADLPKIRSVVALYPPTDLAEWFRKDTSGRAFDLVTKHIGGTPDQKPEQYKAVSPVSYLDRQLPPTLLIESGRDQYDLGVQTALLANKLKATPNKVVHLAFPWAGHAFDFVFGGLSAQTSLYYIERFLGFTLNN
jgi:acetyl esterase/lipase